MRTNQRFLVILGFLIMSASTLVAAQDCATTLARPLVAPQVLGDGTPGSVTRADLQAALDIGGHIFIDQGAGPTSIAIDSELVATQGTVLDGGGLVSLDGGGISRVLMIDDSILTPFTVTVQHLGIINGNTASGSGAGIYKPGGIAWQMVSLELIDVTFSNNHAIQTAQDDGGGAVYATGLNNLLISDSTFTGNSGSNGGAIYSLGSVNVRITDSLLQGNSATGFGGNPGNGGNGGAIGIDGGERQFNLCRSQMIGNQSNAHGAGFFSVMYDQISLSAFVDVNFQANLNMSSDRIGGGAYVQGGPFLIERVAFISNEGPGGGGVFLGPSANGTIVNTTFFGNIATFGLGGALYVNDPTVILDLRHATIVGNSAPGPVNFAGGVVVGASNQVTMSNTILANNTGGNEFNPWNILNPVNNDGGGNMQFPMTRPNGQTEVAATPTVIWSDPLVFNPANNGGPTPTMALDLISPAIDAGNAGMSTPLDQRGELRDSNPDIGAFEETSDTVFRNGFE